MAYLVQKSKDGTWQINGARTIVSPETGALIARADLIRALEAGKRHIAEKFAAALAEDEAVPADKRVVDGTERFEERDGLVMRVFDVEDRPRKPKPTADEALAALAKDYRFESAQAFADALQKLMGGR